MFFSVWQRATSNAGSSHWHPWAGSVFVVVMHSMHCLALGLIIRFGRRACMQPWIKTGVVLVDAAVWVLIRWTAHLIDEHVTLLLWSTCTQQFRLIDEEFEDIIDHLVLCVQLPNCRKFWLVVFNKFQGCTIGCRSLFKVIQIYSCCSRWDTILRALWARVGFLFVLLHLLTMEALVKKHAVF